MPAVEITTTKSTIVTRCIEYRDDVETRTDWLREAERGLDEEPPLDDMQSVKILLEEQEDLLARSVLSF